MSQFGELWDSSDQLRIDRWRIVSDEVERLYDEMAYSMRIPSRFIPDNITRKLLQLFRFKFNSLQLTKESWDAVDNYEFEIKKHAVESMANVRCCQSAYRNGVEHGSDSMGERIARTRLGMSGGLSNSDYEVLHPLDWP